MFLYQSHGVPQFFGIYFAMGFALILEGFMSSFYHICPNDSNFQFGRPLMKAASPPPPLFVHASKGQGLIRE